MFTILEKRLLAENIYLMKVEAPRVAHAALPGQFVIVRADALGERIPLTIADYDTEEGSVTIVIQTLGLDAQDLPARGGRGVGRLCRPAGSPLGVCA